MRPDDPALLHYRSAGFFLTRAGDARPDADFPGATLCEQRSIALPLFPGLSDAEQDRVIDALRA